MKVSHDGELKEVSSEWRLVELHKLKPCESPLVCALGRKSLVILGGRSNDDGGVIVNTVSNTVQTVFQRDTNWPSRIEAFAHGQAINDEIFVGMI